MSLTYNIINANTDAPTIYLNQTTSLDVTLTNNYTDDIIAKNGLVTSQMSIYLPSYFTSQDIARMVINKTDWDFTRSTDNAYLILSYAGTDNYTWGAGADFTFIIEQVCESSAVNLPLDDSSVIQFSNFTNNPSDTTSNELTLDHPPTVGAADLRSVLQVFLNDQGIVYVSSGSDVLENILFLNFKNIGTDPLSTSGQPSDGVVTVRFIYGDTVGALTNNDKGTDGNTPPSDSAWNIVAAAANDSGGDWSVAGSNITASSNPLDPTWTLRPEDTNTEIIGTAANANLSFSFSKIVSSLPTGNTQMVVEFSGFMKDADTPYNDTTFVLNIVKLNPPALRGLTNFSCDTLRHTVAKPDDVVTLNLSWSMYYVDRVEILASLPTFEPIDYPTIDQDRYLQPIDSDNQSIALTGIYQSGTISVTVQAYDANDNLLNRMELTVYVQSTYVVGIINTDLPIIKEDIQQMAALFNSYFKGVIRFYPQALNKTISSPGTVSFDIYWMAYATNQIIIMNNEFPNPTLENISLEDTPSLQTGTYSFTSSEIYTSMPLRFTIKALDSGGNLINSIQFTSMVHANFFVDPAGTVYPAMQVGSLLWMTKNLNYSYDGMPGLYTKDYDSQYGCYYTLEGAMANIPDGWRLPTLKEWKNLINYFGSTNLTPSGSSGFNPKLGGYYENVAGSNENNVGSYGYYWSSRPKEEGSNYYFLVYEGNTEACYDHDTDDYFSVRYVKDIDF